MASEGDRCEVPGCKNRMDYIYYRYRICEQCFKKHFHGVTNLKDVFGINRDKKPPHLDVTDDKIEQAKKDLFNATKNKEQNGGN